MASAITLAATPHPQLPSSMVYSSPSFPASNSSAGPRSRTTSLLSSMSASLPHFSGRLSFGGRGGKEGAGGEGGERKRRLSGKGKERAFSNDLPSHPSKTKMPLFGRHFSNPSTPPPLAPACSGSKKKGEASMASTQRRAATFSLSSPELSGPASLPLQPWSALGTNEEHNEQAQEYKIGLEQTHGHSSVAKYASRAARSFSSLVHSLAPLPPPIPPPTIYPPRPLHPDSDSDEEPVSPRSALATYAPPPLPSFSPPPSPSLPSRSTSPLDPSRRAQAHAQALAKLTEASSVPFPKRSPPPPVRPPPPPPLDYDRARTRSSSGESEDRDVLRGSSPGRSRRASARGRKEGEGAVAKVKWFLERELGEKGLERREGVGGYEERENVEEEALWAALRDGVVLCRLLNHLSPQCPPLIPSVQIDHRGLPSSVLSNLTIFLSALVTAYRLPASSTFHPSDLLSRKRAGFQRVLLTLSLLEDRFLAPPPLSRPSLEINSKGRAIRTRSANTGSSSGHGWGDGSESTGDRHTSSSPDSSRFTDYSFGGGRRSLEVPSSSGPSVTFVDRVKERERDSRDWSGGKNKVYGDRRMAESAIDVLSVVEEDEGSRRSRSHARHSQPTFSPAPSPTPVRVKRYNSEIGASLWIEGNGVVPIPKARARHSSEMVRPQRLVLQRSFSNSATEPSSSEREEHGAIRMSDDLSPTSRAALSSSPTPLSSVPFPLSSSPPFSRSVPRIETEGSTPPPRPRQHQRWNSELYVERPVGREEGGEAPRTRHESLVEKVELRREDSKSKRGARTKLVLREDGRPTLTYQLGECIGRGQFGSVYRALNLNSGRVVAVKRIQLAGKSEEEIEQLSNEVSILKSLVHPGVVKYEGLVRTEHFVNIILEYVENGSLQKTLKHFGELPESLVASYVVKILEGLDFLHSKQVVHCDLKAANILSTKNGNVKLSDFGVSLNLNAVQNITKDVNEVNGTPNWMAPEIIELKGASTASDIWSLACTIIELITGKPPYSEMLAMSAMFRIVEDDRPPIPERCSPELSDFLCLCFNKDPRKRPTAEELFSHVWLQKNWDPQKDLRPQDSIPFLRRISSEMRRPEMDIYGSPIQERMSPSPADLSFYSSSPLSARSPLFPDLAKRGSSDSGYRLSTDYPSTPEPQRSLQAQSSPAFSNNGDDSQRSHAFVKTTFSKAIECKLCGEQTKRHAVLCKDCGLICHQRCSEFAPLPCDLRSQLLSFSRDFLPHGSRTPLSTSLPTPASPLASANGFISAVILPFGKARRSKTSPPPLLDPPSLPSTPAARRRNFSDLLRTRTRSPGSTPPASVSGRREGSVASYASATAPPLSEDKLSNMGSPTSGRHGQRASLGGPTVTLAVNEHRGPVNPAGTKKLNDDWLVGRKFSVVETPAGTKLHRSRSHSRSESAPIKKSESDCTIQ